MLLGLLGLIANPLVRIDGVLSTFSEESLNNLMWNAIGGGVLIGWHLFTGIVLFMGLSRMGLLRVKPQAEIQGLDLSKHKEIAYGFGRGTTPLPNFELKFANKTNTVNVATIENSKVVPLHAPEF